MRLTRRGWSQLRSSLATRCQSSALSRGFDLNTKMTWNWAIRAIAARKLGKTTEADDALSKWRKITVTTEKRKGIVDELKRYIPDDIGEFKRRLLEEKE